MIKNYFKTAWRFLLKNKSFCFINIIGLSVGTLCCLYILLYVRDQYSYDTHFKNAKDIYRIVSFIGGSGGKSQMATCSPPIAPAMKNDFPEVEQFTRIVPTLGSSNHLLRYKDKSFYNDNAYLVDSTFFDVFNFHFNYGNAANALTEPNSIVLLKPVAEKLFGKGNPIGKIITIEDSDGKNNFKVTGVIDESLGKSEIHANMLIRMNENGYGGDILSNTTWTGNNFTSSFIKLRPGTNVAALEKKLPAFLNKYGAEQFKNSGMEKQLLMQPITSIHTTAGYAHEMTPTVSSTFLNILILIAILIQIIACINFMNLSTAKASKRAKEVGVRKVMGAEKGSLRIQFLTESFLLSFLSVLIALPLLIITLPYLNQITHAEILLSALSGYRIWFMLCGIVIVTSLIAGSYPAFYLSAFQAVKVIKGNFTSHISAAGTRRSLVVFQFVLSIVLIDGIIIIYSQLYYIKNKDLGFNNDHRLIFSFYTNETKSRMHVFANDLNNLSEVKAVSLANNYLGSGGPYHDWTVYLPGGNPAAAIDQQNLACDENFVKTTGIQILSGMDFRFTDSDKVMINETLMKRLGLNLQNAPGSKLLATIINSFTLMAILISCLGLFGLVAFSAEQRKKEIGVRKVLGASVASVVELLSKEFIKLVGISILVATPIAWWVMNKWLQGFAYRVHISWWMFAVAGVVALLIAFLTVSFQAIKAALANPVTSLRTE